MDTTAKKNLDPSGTMSLGDHLEELRVRLILALSGLAIGMVISLIFGQQIIAFIQRPYFEVVASMQATVETDPNKTVSTAPSAAQIGAPKLQTLAPADGIVSYIKIALIAGLIMSSPWVSYQIWLFVAAGLYAHEKRFVNLAAPFSAALFIIGSLFFLFVVAPLTLTFLIKFNENILHVNSNFTFSFYISFVTMLTLIFGMAFQTPIAIYFLNRTGLVSIANLKGSRKFVILAIVILAAMATPPDVVSQVTLAIPIYLLYELGILLCIFTERKAASESNNP